ncbi:hypothetical protein [Streptomyces goshikiensis]|uniref:hypothetical protein n=1 Tax=Streptomyces goshikiensis TaxID=1942 RepID=UPI0037A5C9A7
MSTTSDSPADHTAFLPGAAPQALPIEHTAAFHRGGPVLAVTVHRHMIFGPGALTNCVDFTVLVHLLFAVAGDESVTVDGLLERLRSVGISSPGAANKLIGRDAVYQSLRRLLGLGFIRKVQDRREDGTLGPVSYAVYEQPLYNPDVAKVPHFAPIPAQAEAASSNSTFPQVRATSGSAPSGSAASGSARSGEELVSAGQSHFGLSPKWQGDPPHTPQGVDNPPTPTKSVTASTADATVVTRRQGDAPPGRKTNPERLAHAADFLTQLPGALLLNTKQRRKLAPLLLEQMDLEGLQLGPDLLAQLLNGDNINVRSAYAVVKHRINDLKPLQPKSVAPRREVADPCPSHPHKERSECLPCQAGGNGQALPSSAEVEEPQPDPQETETYGGDAAAEAKAAMAAAKAERERRTEAKANRARGYKKKLAKDREAEEAAAMEERNRILNAAAAAAAAEAAGQSLIDLAEHHAENSASPQVPAREPSDVQAALNAFRSGFQIPPGP